MIRKATLIVICSIMWSVGVEGQDILGLNAQLQRDRIGLVDEFFGRFNGEHTHPSIPASVKDSRKQNLMMLFNLGMFKSKSDPYMAEAAEMMDSVIANDIKLHYADTTWLALAHCVGKLEGKTVKFDITLKVQHRKEDMYKWVISKVEGDFFDISAKNKNEMIMFYPDDHETRFMSIGRMTEEQPYNVERFLGKDVSYDMTSVFAYLVYNKKLSVDYVEDLEFVFRQIPGYVFHLRYFDRDKNNAGWLISQFYKIGNENVKQTLKDKQNLSSQYNREDTLKEDERLLGVNERPIAQTHNLEKSFNYRLNERLEQLQDYVSFIQHYKLLNKNGDMKNLYLKRMERLFVPNSVVKARKAISGDVTTLSVWQFGEKMWDSTLTLLHLDSINVPIWDDVINSLDESVTECALPSGVKRFKKDDLLNGIIGELSNQTLAAYKVNTEDGVEWIPLLGDLTVVIKDQDENGY